MAIKPRQWHTREPDKAPALLAAYKAAQVELGSMSDEERFIFAYLFLGFVRKEGFSVEAVDRAAETFKEVVLASKEKSTPSSRKSTI